jgi:hypothetical protein
MVLVPAGGPNQQQLRYWLPGALVDKEIYLFDTRMGMPLPGPNGQGVATLSQTRNQPELLKALTVDAKFPYDVTAEQVKKAEVHVAYFLSSLAPRMRFLQDLLSSSDKIVLGVDPLGVFGRFQAALKEPAFEGIALKVWNQPGDLSTPIRVLRQFLPPDEGGVDGSKLPRRVQVRLQLVPKHLMPQVAMEAHPVFGQRLQTMFSVPFIALVEPHTPRDLVLRGRLDDATGKLVTYRDELNRARKQVRSIPKLEEEINQWRDRTIEVGNALAQAQEALASPRTKSAAAQEALTKGNQVVEQMWKNSQKVQLVMQAAFAEPLMEETTYLLALCRQEQAERAQAVLDQPGKEASETDRTNARELWSGAASWWVTYLNEYDSTPSAPAARWLLARVRLALGEREGAVSVLENFAGEPAPLEKTARLYLIKQWRAR